MDVLVERMLRQYASAQSLAEVMQVRKVAAQLLNDCQYDDFLIGAERIDLGPVTVHGARRVS